MNDISMRQMFLADLSKVIKLEYAVYDCPWRKEEFTKAINNKTTVCLVIAQYDKIVGYVIADIKATATEILNITVDPTYRRLGLATMLVNKLKSDLNTIINEIILSVIETNLGMQLFLRSQGFKAISISKGAYDEYVSDDAILFKFAKGT